MNSSLIQNSTNISKFQENKFLPEVKRNFGERCQGTKTNNFITEFIGDSNEKIEKNKPKHDNNINDNIRLEDGISINIIKSHGEKRIKKFLHVPDFNIYVIKVFIIYNFKSLYKYI